MSAGRSPRDLLARQRRQIGAYRKLLQLQRAALERHDLNAMDEYLAREQELMHDISVRDRLIPSDLPGWEELQEEYAAARREHDANRHVLESQLEDVAARIQQIRLPRRAREVYGRDDASGAMLDVTL